MSCKALVIGLGLTTLVASTPALAGRAATPNEQEAIKRSVLHALKDPESARFGDFIVGVEKDGTITVCGWVNAKNSYGGYTGMSPFYGLMTADPLLFLPVGIGGDRNMTKAIRQMCTQGGAPL